LVLQTHIFAVAYNVHVRAWPISCHVPLPIINDLKLKFNSLSDTLQKTCIIHDNQTAQPNTVWRKCSNYVNKI